MRIGILGYDNCLGGEIFGFADLLHFANGISLNSRPDEPPPFEVKLVGARRGDVVCATGARMSVAPPDDGLDLLVTPGFGFNVRDRPEGRFAKLGAELDLLRRLEGRVPIASVCVGSFVLAEAGLLDGRDCTTAWLFAPDLAQRHPQARVRPEAMIVEDRGVTTTGAFSATHDLALKIVRERTGEGLARALSRLALLDGGRASQAPYVDARLRQDLISPFAQRVRAALEPHLAEPYDLSALAERLNVSTRTLLRRFKAEAGRTPLEELQGLRVSQAKQLLETTGLSLGEVAAAVGYQDLSTFGRLFSRLAAMSPAAYRRRFRAAA